jgi:hypothetical protein
MNTISTTPATSNTTRHSFATWTHKRMRSK